MKKYLFVIALVSLVILASGCMQQGPTKTTNTKTYSNATYGYSFEYPETWEKFATGSGMVGFRDNVTGTNVVVAVTPHPEPTEKELNTLLSEFESEYGTTFQGFEKISGETVTINNLKGFELVYKWRLGNSTVQQRQVFLFKDNNAYIITFTSTPKEYADDNKKFDAILNSFKVQ